MEWPRRVYCRDVLALLDHAELICILALTVVFFSSRSTPHMLCCWRGSWNYFLIIMVNIIANPLSHHTYLFRAGKRGGGASQLHVSSSLVAARSQNEQY
jgi:hypothetical protein